jgi:hypothetical protein
VTKVRKTGFEYKSEALDRLERIIDRASAGNPFVKAALQKAAIQELEAEAIRKRLEQAVREETTLEGAVEKAFANPSNRTGPASYGAGETRGAAHIFEGDDVRKTTKTLRERAGLDAPNFGDVRPDGTESTHKRAKPKGRVKFAPGSDPR